MDDNISWYADRFAELVGGVGAVIKGKESKVRLAVTCVVAEGHLLIDDVPGTGKTALAKTLAALIGGSCSRIQFTPDLLPADVTGVTIFNQRSQTFEFHEGPVFANIVLADEINRAAPKTQSALLEVMEEQQVTVDNTTHFVPRPFTVIATQNPVEFEGTYQLPEAQLDRFLMRIKLDYPTFEDERRVVESGGASVTIPTLRPVSSLSTVQTMRSISDSVELTSDVLDYILRIAHATRSSEYVRLGVSTRGVLAMVAAARAYAAAERRSFVGPDDVKALVEPVWSHRCMLTPAALFEGKSSTLVLAQLVEEQRVNAVGAR